MALIAPSKLGCFPARALACWCCSVPEWAERYQGEAVGLPEVAEHSAAVLECTAQEGP